MKPWILRIIVATFLALCGVAYSYKGGSTQTVKISRFVANDGTFVTLEWNTLPDKRYAVETSIDMNNWDQIAKDLIDPAAPRAYVYQIPNAYVFDSRRFFRVVTTDK